MKKLLITCLLFLVGFSSQAQSPERWIAFWDSNHELKGFKDSKGVVKVEPKFSNLRANYFDNIMAVFVKENGKYKSYYLTKAGKIVGRDSLYYYDNGEDCESEGFIRFREKKTDLVGMFDRNGKIVIPADYNGLSRVQNGHVWALKGATKRYLDKDAEHFSYEGGEEMLLNTKNGVVLRNTKRESYLNLFSFTTHFSKPAPDPIRQYFEGANGQFYSFIDYEKEFKDWLYNQLLESLTARKLLKASHDSITFWHEPDGWINEAKADFLKRNLNLIKTSLLVLKEKKADFFISIDGLNPFIFNGPSFSRYYNNCGESLTEKYPTIDLVINSRRNGELSQDHFGFLRTEKGYKLINLTIRDAKLK
ncbi:WG repeat-containing protein [Rufibacter soli]